MLRMLILGFKIDVLCLDVLSYISSVMHLGEHFQMLIVVANYIGGFCHGLLICADADKHTHLFSYVCNKT